MTFDELLKNQRSVRDYQDIPVSVEVIKEMINELGIPDDCSIVAPIILGYPEKIPSARKRKAPEILKIIT